MAPVSPVPLKKSKRNVTILIILITIVIVYTIGWFILAGKVQQRAERELQILTDSGIETQCEDLTTSGFPIAMQINCEQLNWAYYEQDIYFNASSVSVGSTLFSPRQIRNKLNGPATIDLPGIVPLQANWDDLSSRVKFSGQHPENIVLLAENFQINPVSSEEDIDSTTDTAYVSLKELQFELNSLFAPLRSKLSFDDFSLSNSSSDPASDESANESKLPAISGLIEVTSSFSLNDLIETKGDATQRLHGKDMQIKQALFMFPQGAVIDVSGPASLSETGLLNADLKIRLVRLQALAPILQQMLPAQAGNIPTLMFTLNALPKDESGASILPLNIRDGKVSAGFIPLGRIPAL